MKQWAIMVSAVIAGVVIYRWWGQQKTGPAAQNAANDPSAIVSSLAPRGLYSGVPTFDDTAVANGHGDQVVAAFHDNELATVVPTGYGTYQPAFGPQENRNDGIETF